MTLKIKSYVHSQIVNTWLTDRKQKMAAEEKGEIKKKEKKRKKRKNNERRKNNLI